MLPEVADLNHLIVACRGQSLAVGGKGEGEHDILVRLLRLELLAVGEIPKTDDAVPASGGEHFSVRRVGN